MIRKLKMMELEYVRCFAEERNFKNHIEFRDKKFRNTYTSNISILNEDLEIEALIELINKEIKFYRRSGRDFLNFELNQSISDRVLEKLIIKPKRVDRFNYHFIESKKYKHIEETNRTKLKKAESEEDFNNLIEISVKDNKKILGTYYSRYRIKRKIEAYRDFKNNLSSYICFYENIPVGSCEVLIKDNICKLEDIGILKEYRGKGFGSFMIREILKNNHKNGVKYTYLISEYKGEAEKLYKKLGFVNCGEKTQLIW